MKTLCDTKLENISIVKYKTFKYSTK